MNVADDAPATLTRTLRTLPEPWTLLRNRQIAGAGGTEPVPVDLVLVHPEIGVALVDEAPRDPTPAVAALRDYLAAQRFSEFCPGDLPIVALSVPVEKAAEAGERLAAAFYAAPRLSIADRDWADAVIELLLIPDDLAMPPAVTVEGAAAPALAEEKPEPPPAIRPMRPDPAPADAPVIGALDRPPETDPWASLTDWESPRIPLRVDWPIAAAAAARRRRRLAGAGFLGLLLVGGAAGAAWQLAREEPGAHEAALAPPSQDIEIPLTPPLLQHRSAPPPQPAPPPLPRARPVTLAAKTLALPPPPPPVPTPVEPLPRVVAKAPAVPSPPTVVPTPPKATANATAAPPVMRPAAAARPQPPAFAHAKAAPARRQARAEPSVRPPAETSDGPPIDAMDLPPAALAYTAAPRARREAHAEPSSRPPAESSDGPPIDATELPPLDTAVPR
jgi:hypothetical protein